MPYIPQSTRDIIDQSIDELVASISDSIDDDPEFAGIMNYTITTLLCKIYGPRWRYHKINEVIGVVECVKQEFYRRLAGPYEDQAIEKNGDIDGYRQ